MNELISIIVNAYNEEKHIKKCIDSVICQTYKKIEIVVINDGSTDNTLSILNSYDDSRLKIITHENKGLSLSRNDGIDNSNGKYVYFLDADDFIEQDNIEYLYNLIIKYDADMSTCGSIDVYNYDVKIENMQEKIDILSNIEMLKKVLLNKNNSVNIWNKLIKKELFNNIRFPDRIIEDVPVTYKLALLANKIVCSNQIKYNRLLHKDSITGKKNASILIDIYDTTMERFYDLKERLPNLIENDISVLFLIMDTYAIDNKEVNNYIGIKNMKKIFKQLFSIRIFKVNLSSEDKLKLILFRISPYSYKTIFKIHIKIKNIRYDVE